MLIFFQLIRFLKTHMFFYKYLRSILNVLNSKIIFNNLEAKN